MNRQERLQHRYNTKWKRKLFLTILFTLLIGTLGWIGYEKYKETNLPNQYKALLEKTFNQARAEIKQLAVNEKKDKGAVLAYYPVDDKEQPTPNLAKVLDDEMAQVDMSNPDDVTVLRYKVTTQLGQYTVYELYKERYHYQFGDYVLKKTELLSTTYQQIGKQFVPFSHFLADPGLDKAYVENLLTQFITQTVPAEKQAFLLQQVKADQIDALQYVYTNDTFNIRLKGEQGGYHILDLTDQPLIVYFRENAVLDTYKKIYQEYHGTVQSERESQKKYNSKEAATSISQSTPKKQVALTFDDGPHAENTQRILDILKKYNVKATFYILANNIAGNEAVLKRTVAEGHELGNHTMSHPFLPNLSGDALKNEINQARELIEKEAQTTVKSIRPPFGAFNAQVAIESKMPVVNWSVDSNDWALRNGQAMANHVLANAHDGAIILMHDIHKETADGVEAVVAGLQAKGYEFVTVSQMYPANQFVSNVLYLSQNSAQVIAE